MKNSIVPIIAAAAALTIGTQAHAVTILTGNSVKVTYNSDIYGSTGLGTYTAPTTFTPSGFNGIQVTIGASSITVSNPNSAIAFQAGPTATDFLGFHFDVLTGTLNITGLSLTSSGVLFGNGYIASSYTPNSVDLSLNGTFFHTGSTLSLALSPTGAVPEPATWAMLLVGFGAVGGAMRARRSKKPYWVAA